MLKIIVALKKEVGNLSGYDVYYSGCGKVNATISTMEAISAGVQKRLSTMVQLVR